MIVALLLGLFCLIFGIGLYFDSYTHNWCDLHHWDRCEQQCSGRRWRGW